MTDGRTGIPLHSGSTVYRVDQIDKRVCREVGFFIVCGIIKMWLG